MLANKKDSVQILKSLKKKFLYENDINSMHLLLNLYEIEDDLGSIYPEYISLGNLRKNLMRYLRYRKGYELAAKNLAELIHDDINRFELYIYLESYRAGFKSTKYVNLVEKTLLSYIDVNVLYTKKYFQNNVLNDSDLDKHKKELKATVKKEIENNDSFRKVTNTYTKRIIRNRLLELNKYLDRQLTMVENEKRTVIQYESKPFRREELINLYRKICKMMHEDALRIFEDAYWRGLIDKVLSRYK